MFDLIVEIIQTVDCLRCKEKISCSGTSFNPRDLHIGVGNLPAQKSGIFFFFQLQCHGSGAQGAIGYPNLLDNDWLWGGDVDSIAYTVTHGIRNETDPDAVQEIIRG